MKSARLTDPPARPLVAATYNIHSGIGRDRLCNLDRVVEVINEIGADFVGLQEVGHRHDITDYGEQFLYIERATGLHAVAGPNVRYDRDSYGNALLSRWPVSTSTLIDLSVPKLEPRGAIDAVVDVAGRFLRILVTHLGLGPTERLKQIRKIVHRLDAGEQHPTVIMGDFNMWGFERYLLRRLGAMIGGHRAPASFPSRLPVIALDRLWTVPAVHKQCTYAHRTPLAAIASDHLPVVMQFTL